MCGSAHSWPTSFPSRSFFSAGSSRVMPTQKSQTNWPAGQRASPGAEIGQLFSSKRSFLRNAGRRGCLFFWCFW
jgi:hypothetical protein